MAADPVTELERTLDARIAELGLAPTVGPSETIGVRSGERTLDGPDAGTPTLPMALALPQLSVDLEAADADRPPGSERTSDLTVLGLLGAGGMGRVLVARQHSLDREVAIKTAHEDASPAVQSALLREGRISGRLEHPAIVPVHALGTDPRGRPVLVMKRIEGVGWDVLLADPKHEAWADWEGDDGDRLAANLSILSTICNAVHFAHSRGIVHRDLKPENVLIGRFGDVYLADWGVAAPLGKGAGRLAGTPGFMAPEMVTGGVLDARTDVYLLGAVLHTVLTGRPRHDAKTLGRAVYLAAVSEPVEYPSDVPEELGALVNAACHVEPGQRPPTALDFREALSGYLRHRAARDLADEAIERLPRIVELAAARGLEDSERVELDRLTAEARFGLERALEALDSDARVEQALAELGATLEERQARVAALEQLAEERDATVGARGRLTMIRGMAVFAVAIAAVTFYRQEPPGPLGMFLVGLILFTAVSCGLFWLRGSVLNNTIGRALAIILILPVGVMVVTRGIGLVVEMQPHEHFARELFVMGAACIGVGVQSLRWVSGIGGFALLSGVLCVALPAQGFLIFGFATSAMMLAASAFAWRDRQIL